MFRDHFAVLLVPSTAEFHLLRSLLSKEEPEILPAPENMELPLCRILNTQAETQHQLHSHTPLPHRSKHLQGQPCPAYGQVARAGEALPGVKTPIQKNNTGGRFAQRADLTDFLLHL